MTSADTKQSEAVQFAGLPEMGFVRLAAVLSLIPVSKSSWWQGIREGRYPKGIKLGPRTTAWRVEDIRALIQGIE